MRLLSRSAPAALLSLSVLGCGGPSPMPEPDAGAPTDAPPALCAGHAECDDGRFCNGEERCAPGDPGADGRGCVAGEAPCGAGSCDEAAGRCAGACDVPDADGDGADAVECGGDDCDDGDPRRYPGAAEVCDPLGLDEDCDPETFGARDADGDGAISASCCNGDACGDDCDDARASVRPGAPEVCDALDNDCDGDTDEGVVRVFRVDADGDGFGDPAGATREECLPPSGFVEDASDCDDGARSSNPAAAEICDDGADNDCDGATDEAGDRTVYRDDDGDGFGDPTSTMVRRDCSTPAGFVTIGGDCNDDDPATHPGAADPCDRRDTNCSLPGFAAGGIDVSEDFDGDGHAPLIAGCVGGFPADDCDDFDPFVHPDPSGGTERCDGRDSVCAFGGGPRPEEDMDGDDFAPVGAPCAGGAPRTDCDDTRPEVFPGAPEICDRLDSNCTEGGGPVPAEDVDGDGHAAPTAPCLGGPLPKDDCDDAVAAIYPGAPEICDGRHSDCAMGGGPRAAEDADGDGVSATDAPCSGGPLSRTDCDDTRAYVEPGAPEACDGALDEDCDGVVDEASADRFCGPSSVCTAGVCGGPSPALGVTYGCALVGGVGQCWGREPSRLDQEGAGYRAPSPHPDAPPGAPDEVSIGEDHMCWRVGGEVYCEGSNARLQAGIAGGGHVSAPTTAVGRSGGPLADAVAVAAGPRFTCARRVRGEIVCWGEGTSGQLGDGFRANHARAEPVVTAPGGAPILTGATDLGVGGSAALDEVSPGYARGFGCALRRGVVYCWGAGERGQLGDGGLTSRLYAAPVRGVTDATELAVGGAHACVIVADGGVRCWGNNLGGQLGDGSLTDREAPVAVMDLPAPALELVAGALFTCARLVDGRVACWGLEALGDGVAPVGEAAHQSLRPALALGFGDVDGERATALAGSGQSACALREDGSMWCWGENSHGQLGDGERGPLLRRPHRSLFPASALACGAAHCVGTDGAAVTASGTGPARGDGRGGTSLAPAATAFSGATVAAGALVSCAIDADGVVRCAGIDTDGNLGRGLSAGRPSSPEPVVDLPSPADEVGAGEGHACARVGDEVYCWGGAERLGDGTNISRPSAGPLRPAVENVTQLSVGGRHACLLSSTQGVQCWGQNQHGQAGAGAPFWVGSPASIPSLPAGRTWTRVAAGGAHSCALSDTPGIDDLYCWGRSDFGQSGPVSPASPVDPGPAFSSLDVVEVAAGALHTCVVSAAGTVHCVGDNTSGQLGRAGPVADEGAVVLSAAEAVFVGPASTCARTTAGEIYCWGDNAAGQLGTGAVGSDSIAPVRVLLP